MRRARLIAGLAAATVVVLAAETLFVVGQRGSAVVASFGAPVRVIDGARDGGLHAKLPFLQDVTPMDGRDQMAETHGQSITSADGRALMVDAGLRWRVADPLRFWRTVGDQAAAADTLEPLAFAAVRRVLASASAADIVAGRRDALIAQALAAARASARPLGVQIDDLYLRRLSLAPAGAEAATPRLRTALQQRAGQIRADGEANRRQIMAAADARATETLAKAGEQAAAVRGAGDAQAAQLSAAAYGQDPSFADFYRSMRAYETALARPDATLVLSPDSDFFKYFRLGAKAR